MGSLVNGINGPVKGKVGTVHGSSRYGKAYIKGPHKKRTTRISNKEKQNRFKFSEAQLWLKPIINFVRQGFNGFIYKEASQGFAAAKSHILLNAFRGQATSQFIDPALVKVSYGSLRLPDEINVELIGKHQLKFSWKNNPAPGMSEFDQAMLLAYDIDNKLVSMKITGQFRYAEEDILELKYADPVLPKEDSVRIYHCYFAFVAADRKRQSDSIYLGAVPIS